MFAVIPPAVGDVLSRFAGGCSLASAVVPLGGHGGFSGAHLWRVETVTGPLCLKAWPSRSHSADHLRFMHRLMRTARSAALSFVPEVMATPAGDTVVEHLGSFWDLTTWMPGVADFHARPESPRLAAAIEALAGLHSSWRPTAPEYLPCPAVRRRLGIARAWQVGPRPEGFGRPVTDAVGARARRALDRHLSAIVAELQAWEDRRVPVQPCVGDLWHDHVLFVDDRVGGIIDFGSVKVDHVAVDLGRLLGSLVGDDRGAWDFAMERYRRVRSLDDDEITLSRLLDRSGTLLALTGWLRRFERDPDALTGLITERVTRLLARVEGWE